MSIGKTEMFVLCCDKSSVLVGWIGGGVVKSATDLGQTAAAYNPPVFVLLGRNAD